MQITIESRPPSQLRRVRVLRPSALDAVVTADADDAFEALVERWRLQAFDVYAGIREAQRTHRTHGVPARLGMLCSASEIAQTMIDEIAALRVAALSETTEVDYAGVAR